MNGKDVLRRIVREQLQRHLEESIPVMSTLDIKPGMRLRYTGQDMAMPPNVKVLSVDAKSDTVTVGDNRGQVHKITKRDLHDGTFEPMN